MSSANTVDLVIVGGGIAGLWLANVFAASGYRLLLLEGHALGSGQTLASQGMIHGGIKYSLDATVSRAAVAISAMPGRWREALAGQGSLDLSRVRPRSQRYYLFAQDTALGKLGSFFASKALRGRVEKLRPTDYPLAFQDPGFHGVVYSVDDLVIDTSALLRVLYEGIADCVYRHQLGSEQIGIDADAVTVRVANTQVRARHLLLCAGAGNGALIEGLGLPEPQMQLRPLHQVLVYHDYPHPMFAHCLTGTRTTEPRMTITSHASQHGALWYLGGQLASDGVELTGAQQQARARSELQACLPWISWDDARIETLRVDRAEPRHPQGKRPDHAFAQANGPIVTCWPTKLSLMPDLADRVQAMLDPPSGIAEISTATLNLPKATVGVAPWER